MRILNGDLNSSFFQCLLCLKTRIFVQHKIVELFISHLKYYFTNQDERKDIEEY